MFSAMLLQAGEEIHVCYVHINRARSRNPNFVNQVLIERIDDKRKEILRSVDSGADEIEQVLLIHFFILILEI